MRAKAIGPLLGAVAVAALLIPGAAAARPTGKKPASRGAKSQVVESFQARGTNGFTFSVTLAEHHHLVVDAEAPVDGSHGSRQAIYTLPAPQSPHSDDIKARIGSLGKIDVRFVPESTKETSPHLLHCTGGVTVTEKGHFVGLISFRGERGYTQVHAGRAKGTVVSETIPRCKHVQPSPRERATAEKEAEQLEGQAKEVSLGVVADHGKVRFAAFRNQVDSKVATKSVASFTAAAARIRGKVEEVSLVLLLFERGSTFLTPEPLFPTREATISPPAPFSGSATFKREADKSTSWSGDLKVELPGFGDVPLAATGSKATMCAVPGCLGL